MNHGYALGFMPAGFSPLSSPTKQTNKGPVRGEAVLGANIPMITELGRLYKLQTLVANY